MKILLINKFLYPKGGDAIATLDTGRLLSEHGHHVAYWGMNHASNPEYRYKDDFILGVDYDKESSPLGKFRMMANLLYSLEAKKKVEKVIKEEMPDIVHLHNFAHQISPSILHVFKKYKIPSVMTMHDYKLVCPCYTLLSNGVICQTCRGGKFINCFKKKCVKNSTFKSLLNTIEMYLHHSILHIYDLIDEFISPSEFLKDKVKEMGFKGKVNYLPNFVDLKEFEPQYSSEGNTVCYFGRLSHEKGIMTLIEAFKEMPDFNLKIIGSGPLSDVLYEKVLKEKLSNVKFLGYRRGQILMEEIKSSLLTVIPSEWYENNPRSILESFALGKPVLGARIGGIPELVKDGETGYTFESGNKEDLISKVKFLCNHHEQVVDMGKKARVFVENELNAEKHYAALMKIYERVIANKKK